MLSFFFLSLGLVIGWWLRGTKAGAGITRLMSKASAE